MDECKGNNEHTFLLKENNRAEFSDTKTQNDIVMSVRKQTKKQLRTYSIIRLAFMIFIILIAMFLLVYSSYLIVVQFLIDMAQKYNKKLLDNRQIFFQVDVRSYHFNTSCSQMPKLVDCLTANIAIFKSHGVTDIILNNLFTYSYRLVPTFADTESFKRLLTEAEYYKIGVYLVLARPMLKVVGPRHDDAWSELWMDSYDRHNKSCIDGYKTELIKTVEIYAGLGVDGFLINDLPCCVIYPEHFTQNCTFDIIYEIRNVARREGKPSAVIYNPAPKMFPDLMELLSEIHSTYFDAFVDHIFILGNGSVEISSEDESDIFPQKILALNVSNSQNFFMDRYLYETILAFAAGSTLYQPIADLESKISNTTEDIPLEIFHDDLRHVLFISQLKEILANICCSSNSSWRINQYSDTNLFIAMLTTHRNDVGYCILAVNFGQTSADIKARINFKDSRQKMVKGFEQILVTKDGSITTQEDRIKDTFTIPPKSAKIFNIMKDDMEYF